MNPSYEIASFLKEYLNIQDSCTVLKMTRMHKSPIPQCMYINEIYF